MKPFRPPASTLARASYAVCRHGGAPPDIVRIQLALPPETAERLERLFRERPGGGADAMRPRFARHEAHVRAVMGQGGYPALAAWARR
ncbi:MAG: hypothetical protein ACHP9T_10580 [Caulobacterales bacterium]|jgi:hypothetical protein